MRFVSFGGCLTAAALLLGCQSLQNKEPSPEQVASAKFHDRVQLDVAWKDFEKGDFAKSLTGFQTFRSQHPQSLFDVEAQFGEARSQSAAGQWAPAMALYREIVLQRLASNPDLAALAMFYESEPAEALGSDVQALALLQDAERNAKELPVEIRLAGLPARLSTISAKVGQAADARRFSAQALRGLDTLKAQGLTPRERAGVSLTMGQVATNNLSPENFQAHLDSFAGAQIFLLGALESGVAPLNTQALQSIESHYRDLWNIAISPPTTPGLEAGARERAKVELRNRWVGDIGRLIAILRQNQRPDMSQATPEELKLGEFLNSLDSQIKSQLMSTETSFPPTPASLSRQRLKREGTVHSEPLFPNEKRASPAVKPTLPPDPNLQSGEHE